MSAGGRIAVAGVVNLNLDTINLPYAVTVKP
jgi:hypothetical protein